jgi:hypothetical protein
VARNGSTFRHVEAKQGLRLIDELARQSDGQIAVG